MFFGESKRKILMITVFLSLKEAKQSIQFYKNMQETDSDSKVLELEISKLKTMLDHNLSESNNKIIWTTESIEITRKAMIIGVVMVVLNIFNGVEPMTYYTANIFQDTGSNLSPNMSAIIIGVFQVIGTWIATQLVDRSGRKVNIYFCPD